MQTGRIVQTGSEGRRETVRYHQDFYATHELFQEGSWLHKPSQFVLRSLRQLERMRGVRAVDLGCGVGRHTIPMAQRLPPGSFIVGVDLLPLAAERLTRNARRAGVDGSIQAVVADLDVISLAVDSIDMLVSVSALEHSRDRRALNRLLGQCAAATRPGGVHCLIIGTDKVETPQKGASRPAQVELRLSSTEGEELLRHAYEGWDWLDFSRSAFKVEEVRAGESYTLQATNLRLVVRRRASSETEALRQAR